MDRVVRGCMVVHGGPGGNPLGSALICMDIYVTRRRRGMLIRRRERGISFRHHCRISDLAAAYRRRDAIADAAEWINMDGGRWPCWIYDA